jgi:hypothetical protein
VHRRQNEEVLILAMPGTHHGEPYVFLCWISGRDQLMLLVGNFPVTTMMRKQHTVPANKTSTHGAVANSVNPFQVVVMNEYHVTVRCTLFGRS